MRNALLASILYFSTRLLAQEGPVEIYLKSGHIVSTNYALLDNKSPGESFVVINKTRGEKLAISFIDSITAPGAPGKTRYFKPVESYRGLIWGERTYSAEGITIYYTKVAEVSGKIRYKPKHFAYTKNDGMLRELAVPNLIEDLRDNRKSMEYISKGRSLTKKQVLLWTLGGSLALGSLVYEMSFNARDGNVPVTLFVGMAVFITPWFFNPIRYKYYINALKEYQEVDVRS